MSLCYMHCVKNSITFFTITTTDASPRKTFMIEFFLLSCCFFLRSLLVLYVMLSPHKMRDGMHFYYYIYYLLNLLYSFETIKRRGQDHRPLVPPCIYLP